MKSRLHLLCAALVFSLNCLNAQDHLPGYIISLLEDMAESSDENSRAINLAEELSYLIENPVNINSGDVNEIKRLFFLTVFQVASIVDYTNKKGDIISATEISYIPGFDRELTEIMQPFIIYENSHNNRRLNKGYHFRFYTNILADDGETETDFIGSNHKLLSKMRLSSGPFVASVTLDKDNGEPMLLQGYKPDFLSGNITYHPEGSVNKIIIGDYKVQLGQGLTVWNGFSRSLVPTEQRIMKGSSNVMPYFSIDENDFFRGIAISLNTKSLNIISFASMNMIDASIDYDENSGTKYIKSFYYSGVHNTPTTIMKRNQVVESCIGFNVNRMSKNLYTGINAVYTKFSLPVYPAKDIRNKYDFQGRVNASVSFDYAYLFRSSYLYGEFALDENLKTAFLQGISLNPGGRVRFNILYSRVNRGYNSFHGNASGVSTFNKPAINLLANISSELTSFLYFSGGFLRKKELWYNNISGNFPKSIVSLLSLKLKPADFISLTTDIKHRISDHWITPQQGIKSAIAVNKTNLRLSVETVASEQLKLHTRFEKVFVKGSADKGFLCYQSAGYAFKRVPLEILGRLTIFNTVSYDTRIYTWEDDLLYNPVIKPLYDVGKRSYLMIKYSAFNRMTLRVKYAVTDIYGGPESSSRINELKLQVVFSF